jgi:hypothetical protein
MLDNQLDQFADNIDGKQRDESKRILGVQSQEIENKLRFDVNRYAGAWKYSAGAMAQYVKYNNNSYTRLRAEIRDSFGQRRAAGYARAASARPLTSSNSAYSARSAVPFFTSASAYRWAFGPTAIHVHR